MPPLSRQPTTLWLIAILTAPLWPWTVQAGPAQPSLAVSGGIEPTYLKELDSSGSRLLSEKGGRYVISVKLDNQNRYDLQAPFLYHLEASSYAGRLDYSGQSQSLDPSVGNVPFSSQTDYQGGRAEALLGYRLRPSFISNPLEVLGGIGFDNWRRQIQSGNDFYGSPVSGIEEIYRVYYGKLGLGMTDMFSSHWHHHLQAGLKIPFHITEDVSLRSVGYDNDVTLTPGNTYSAFIKWDMEAPPDQGKHGNFLLSFYYEGLRFDPSPSKTVGHSGTTASVWQPETHIDIFGAQMGYRF